MSIVFSDDWTYADGTPVPAFPSRLNSLWFNPGIFGGTVTDNEYLSASTCCLLSGSIGWWDEVSVYTQGTFRFAVKGNSQTGTLNGTSVFQIYDYKETGGVGDSDFLFEIRLAGDGSLLLRDGNGETFAYSGNAHTDTTPLGSITTIPFALHVDTWYDVQLNIEFTVNVDGYIEISACVHIDDRPILAGSTTTTQLAVNTPHGSTSSVGFTRIAFLALQSTGSYLDDTSFDTDSTLAPGSGTTSDGRVTQAIVESITLPTTDINARVSQGVIESIIFPTNFARVSQAVIELLTVNNSRLGEGWKIYEA